MDTVARGAWGFDGYISSDCDAVANVVSPHRYVHTAEEAVAVTLEAGMDIDCSYFVGQHGMRALQEGATASERRIAYAHELDGLSQLHFPPPSLP